MDKGEQMSVIYQCDGCGIMVRGEPCEGGYSVRFPTGELRYVEDASIFRAAKNRLGRAREHPYPADFFESHWRQILGRDYKTGDRRMHHACCEHCVELVAAFQAFGIRGSK